MKKIIYVVLFIIFTLLFACNTAQKITTYNKDTFAESSITSDIVERNYKDMSKKQLEDKLKEFDTSPLDVNIQTNKDNSYTAHIKIADRTIDHRFKVQNYKLTFRQIVVIIVLSLFAGLVLFNQFQTSLPEGIRKIFDSFKNK